MRLFLALLPPESVRRGLAEIAEAAAKRFGGRPTRPETLHLTLEFLGDVCESSLPALDTACRAGIEARRSCEPFDLCLDRLGFWVSKRLLWAGCQMEPPPLLELVMVLRQQIGGYANTVEAAPFVPHVSLLRRVAGLADETEYAGLLTEFFPEGALQWAVGEMALVESRLLATGPEHRVVATYALGVTVPEDPFSEAGAAKYS